MTPEERKLLVELYGEEVVESHWEFLTHFTGLHDRFHGVFPKPPDPNEQCTMSKLEYLDYLYKEPSI